MDNSHPEEECDYSFHVINNLPEFIKEKILEYLPIKEAVRTCILSKDWRHRWSQVHNLYIDVGNRGSNSSKIMVLGSEEELKSNEEALKSNEEALKSTRFIDKVLNLHNGNVHTLKISGAKFDEEDFERLMFKISQMQIRKLILDLECKRRWSLRLCTCQITDNCAMKLPKEFNGLKLLRSLHLTGHCKINETDITKLISSCPLLEELMLNNFSYRILKIHAMNLRKMTLVGNFGDLYLQTPKLFEVFIFLYYCRTVATLNMVVGQNLLQALSSVSHLRYLSICCQCSDTLVGYLQVKNSPIFSNLFSMGLYLRPTDAELTLTLLLFQNAPKLQKLTLSFQELLDSSLSSDYERLESWQEGLFSCLRSVIIAVDPSSDFSIAFAKFILKNAPVLEELIICGNIEDQKITSWSCELKKLSVTTEIIFKVELTKFVVTMQKL